MEEKYILILRMVGVVAALILSLTLIIKVDSSKRVYHCDLAEISPDFPIKAKEACRQLRMLK